MRIYFDLSEMSKQEQSIYYFDKIAKLEQAICSNYITMDNLCIDSPTGLKATDNEERRSFTFCKGSTNMHGIISCSKTEQLDDLEKIQTSHIIQGLTALNYIPIFHIYDQCEHGDTIVKEIQSMLKQLICLIASGEIELNKFGVSLSKFEGHNTKEARVFAVYDESSEYTKQKVFSVISKSGSPLSNKLILLSRHQFQKFLLDSQNNDISFAFECGMGSSNGLQTLKFKNKLYDKINTIRMTIHHDTNMVLHSDINQFANKFCNYDNKKDCHNEFDTTIITYKLGAPIEFDIHLPYDYCPNEMEINSSKYILSENLSSQGIYLSEHFGVIGVNPGNYWHIRIENITDDCVIRLTSCRYLGSQNVIHSTKSSVVVAEDNPNNIMLSLLFYKPITHVNPDNIRVFAQKDDSTMTVDEILNFDVVNYIHSPHTTSDDKYKLLILFDGFNDYKYYTVEFDSMAVRFRIVVNGITPCADEFYTNETRVTLENMYIDVPEDTIPSEEVPYYKIDKILFTMESNEINTAHFKASLVTTPPLPEDWTGCPVWTKYKQGILDPHNVTATTVTSSPGGIIEFDDIDNPRQYMYWMTCSLYRDQPVVLSDVVTYKLDVDPSSTNLPENLAEWLE